MTFVQHPRSIAFGPRSRLSFLALLIPFQSLLIPGGSSQARLPRPWKAGCTLESRVRLGGVSRHGTEISLDPPQEWSQCPPLISSMEDGYCNPHASCNFCLNTVFFPCCLWLVCKAAFCSFKAAVPSKVALI